MSVLEGLAQGFGQAQRQAPQQARLMMLMDQHRADEEQKRAAAEQRAAKEAESRALQQKMAAEVEALTKSNFKQAGGEPPAVTPAQKLEVEYRQDTDGNYSKVIRPARSQNLESILAERVERGELDLDEALRLKAATNAGELSPAARRALEKAGGLEAGTLDGVRKGEIPAGALGSQARRLPANSVLALNEGKGVARVLPDVELAIKENEDIFGPVLGRIRANNPYDDRAKTVDARLRTASQSFGRFMEGGVLRKEDEEKYRKMFPQLSDKLEVAKNKLEIVRRDLAKKYEDDRQTLGASGYDVTGFEAIDIPASLFAAPPATPPASSPKSATNKYSATVINPQTGERRGKNPQTGQWEKIQ